MLEVFGSTDINEKIDDANKIEELENPYRSFVLVLRKGR